MLQRRLPSLVTILRFQCISSRSGKVGAVVAAAALLPTQRRARDESADGEEARRPPVRPIERSPSWSRAISAATRLEHASAAASSPSRSRNSPTSCHMTSRTAPPDRRSDVRPSPADGVGQRADPRHGLDAASRCPLASRGLRAPRRRALRAASCSPAGWRRARRCTPPRLRQTGPACVVRPSRSVCDAAHDVVRRRSDRNAIAGEVEPGRRHVLGDQRKPLVHESGSRCSSDRNTGAPVRAALANDGARRRGRAAPDRRRIVARHEALAVGVHQPRAFAAQRLGQQEPRLPGHVSAVGWNWTNSRSVTRAPAWYAMAMPSPVATGGLVVRGRPDRRHQSRAAPPCARAGDAARRHQKACADAAAVLDDQADDTRVIAARHGGSRATRSQSTRPISRPVASCACSTRRTLCAPSMASAGCAVGVAIERGAPLDQLADVPRAVLDEHLHGARRRTGHRRRQSCRGMQLRRVVRADGRSNTALRVAGVAFARLGFGQDEHVAVPASSGAARRPAMPLPMMRKSARSSTILILLSYHPQAACLPGAERARTAVRLPVKTHRRLRGRDRRRIVDAPAGILDAAGRTGASLRRLEPDGVAPPRRCTSPSGRRRADPDPRRRALQTAGDRRRGSTTRSFARRRSGERRSSPSAAASSATSPALPPPPTSAASP